MSEYNYYVYVSFDTENGAFVLVSQEIFDGVIKGAKIVTNVKTEVYDFVGRVEYISESNGDRKLIAMKSLK